jgi:hypothetical protein
MKDYLEFPDEIPQTIQTILNSRNFKICGYKELARIFHEIESLGWTFDFGLDAEPYDLTKKTN